MLKETFLIHERFPSICIRKVHVSLHVLEVFFFLISLWKEFFSTSFECFSWLSWYCVAGFFIILELTRGKNTTLFANCLFLFLGAVMSSRMICIFKSLNRFGTLEAFFFKSPIAQGLSYMYVSLQISKTCVSFETEWICSCLHNREFTHIDALLIRVIH